MTQMPPKEKVEWSFDFANLGDSVRELVQSLVGENEFKTSEYSVAKNGVTRADVNLHFSVGQCIVTALPESNPQLFEGTFQHVGELLFVADGDTVKSILLKQKIEAKIVEPIRAGLAALVGHRDLRWTMGLGRAVPLNLAIDCGVGQTTLNLSGLTLTNLKINTGVGEVTVTLPEGAAAYPTKITSGVGKITIYASETTFGKLEITGGVGEIELVVPSSVPMQVHATPGLGMVTLASHFQVAPKADATSKKAWQTEGYELADNKLLVEYTGGVGAFRIRTPERA
jgi:hypothetical protein